jgi:UDP-N-acetylmuramyl pentapeptide phosphotransferase/UDP-N-acetylglucosamine-1-phosphate transferase
VRELGLAGEKMKSGTPTMGGIIIILAILVPTLLLADLNKVYVRLMLLCTVWLGVIGFVDDYLKIKAKRLSKEKGIPYKKTNADGLAGKFKIFGQVILGLIIGATLYFNPNVVVQREIIGIGLGVFVFVSSDVDIADYLNIMYIPNLSEVSIFVAAFVGACVGFLWYNAYPAQVFMGDTGSLALGGIIASLAFIVRKELLIPIFCFVFLIENLSVMIQVTYFKYTKRKYGEGRRVFLMSPLHHHYQKLGYHESKIAVRFWVVTILTMLFAVVTLKLR